MAQNVTINGITYQNAPEVDIPKVGGGVAKFMDTSDSDATAADMLAGKTGYVKGQKVTGNIPSKAAASFKPSSADQTIASKQYLEGVQTIKAVQVTGLSAAVIAAGVEVKIGSADDDDCVMSLVGALSSAVISQDSTTKILSIE